ncbi:MAG TPA: hypothetical protein VEW28_03900 [Candidatus Kapabacteria bacterium]|nr:hypothetical protein [Candidatus Kapabacteria bacterium]
MKHTVLILFGLLFAIGAMLSSHADAQQGQIELHPGMTIMPNPSAYLSDWQSNPQTVTVNLALMQTFAQPVKLMAQVTLDGQPVARTNFAKMRMITLHQGINSFNALDLVPYSAIDFVGGTDQSVKRTGRLPEGNYQLCVWFADAETGSPIAGSACNGFNIIDVNPPTLVWPANGAIYVQPELTSLNLTNSQPITLPALAQMDNNAINNLKVFDLSVNGNQYIYAQLPHISVTQPSDGSILTGATTITGTASDPDLTGYHFELVRRPLPDNTGVSTLNFQWLPPMPLTAAGVTYDLKIFPVFIGQNAEEAISIATPIFEQNNISGTTLDANFLARQHYIDFLTRENEGTTFYWSVRATDDKGNSIGKNNGWAEPRLITFGESETAPPANGSIINSFFDIFVTLDVPNNASNACTEHEPCGYHYKERLRKMFGPWKLTKSYSQYANTYTRIIYGVYRVFTCSLYKGHSGPHHGGAVTVYVKEGEEKTTEAPPGPANGPTTGIEPPQYLPDDPAKKDQMDKKDMDKIPTKDEADKKEQDEKKQDGGKNNGSDNNGGKDSGSTGNDNSGTGTGTPNGGKKPDDGKKDDGGTVKPDDKKVDHEPCPYKEHKLLRTVAGSWRKVNTVVKHATYRKTTVAWVEVTWQRDIWNVYRDAECTLEKGHAGPHQCVSHEVYEKWCTFTETRTYGPGEPQTAPTNGPGDDLPQEDPK